MCERYFSACAAPPPARRGPRAGETSGKPLMYVGATPATRPFICRCAAALRAAWRRLRRRFFYFCRNTGLEPDIDPYPDIDPVSIQISN